MRTRLILAGALLLFLVLVWSLIPETNQTIVPSAVPGLAGSSLVRDQQAPEVELPDRVPAAEAGAPATAEEILSDYWGAEWPVVRERLVEAGKDLSRPFDLRPWEEVGPTLREALTSDEGMERGLRDKYVGWPETLDVHWLAQRYGFSGDLSDADLAELDALMLERNQDLEDRCANYLHELSQVLRHATLSEQYRRTPLSTKALDQDRSDPAFYSTGAAGGGWTVKLRLHAVDHPELVAQSEEMIQLRRRRDASVRSWLNQHH